MDGPLDVEVDRSDLDRYIAESKDALARAIEAATEELSTTVATEASSASSRLGVAWPIEPGAGLDRKVVAPEFFAHFLARGTRDHGPKRASRLVFEMAGGFVFATHVAGVRPNPFGERAVERVESRLDQLITETFAEVT